MMELLQLRCTTCGKSISINGNNKQVTCDACDNTFLVVQGLDLNKKSHEEIDILKNLRIQLEVSIERKDIQSIEYHSREILKIIPDDYVSQYYFSYANYNLNKPKAFYDFLEQDHHRYTDQELRKVITHMMRYGDIRDYKKMYEYVNRKQPDFTHAFKSELDLRIQKEDNYSVIERDVFICHRSLDHEIAEKIVVALEEDGHSCWISTRNLRPDDSINYWTNIEEAIEHCKLFLVVSSQEAMLSKDVQKELTKANKLKKEKIEYKIDSSVHTTLFKRSFDGEKWIDAINESKLDVLKERVFDKLEDIENNQETSLTQQADVISQESSLNIDNLVKRMEFEFEIGNLENANTYIDKILDLDIENLKALKLKFVIKNESTNLRAIFNKAKNSYSFFASLRNDNLLKRIIKLDKEIADDFNNIKNLWSTEKRIIPIFEKFKDMEIFDLLDNTDELKDINDENLNRLLIMLSDHNYEFQVELIRSVEILIKNSNFEKALKASTFLTKFNSFRTMKLLTLIELKIPNTSIFQIIRRIHLMESEDYQKLFDNSKYLKLFINKISDSIINGDKVEDSQKNLLSVHNKRYQVSN